MRKRTKPKPTGARPQRKRKKAIKAIPWDRRKRPPARAKLRIKAECDALHRWILSKPAIAGAISWRSASGLANYYQWTSNQRSQLCSMYRSLRDGRPLNLPDPPQNMTPLGDSDWPVTTLAEADAWRLYLAHVANSLLVERGQQAGWSIQTYPTADLGRLLDSRAFFIFVPSTGEYTLSWISPEFGRIGPVVPAPPDLIKTFLTTNGLIGMDRLTTIGLVLEWCRSNLYHFIGSPEAKNMEDHWQYRGCAPVSRIIIGTTYTGPLTASAFGHFTAGCHGTNGLLASLLRIVNIPVEYLLAGQGHATPYFPSEGRYLSHGDDPYNQLTEATPPYAARELLIDEATYLAWFSTALPSDVRQRNIGRQVLELALVYLPNYLLCQHCRDLTDGCTHPQSKVYANFKDWYSVAELEAAGLWNQLDAKLANFGGCANVPGGCARYYFQPGCP